MACTIAEAAKRTGLTVHTLRYYDKEGLLPYVDRDTAGNRSFKEIDFLWLSIITCLKNTGMSIKEIRQYIDWFKEGDSTLELRLEVFKKQKKAVEEKIEELEKYMKKINYKIEYYETAIEA